MIEQNPLRVRIETVRPSLSDDFPFDWVVFTDQFAADGLFSGENGSFDLDDTRVCSLSEATADRLQRTLDTIDRNVERTAETQLEAARTLDEMRETMTSVRFLIETLQQHPESLLQGKPRPEEKK